MIDGRLEQLIAAGFVEGWAFDPAAPERPLVVEIRDGDGVVVAEGLANLYRDDLAKARIGLGWCAFRFRLERPAADLRHRALALHDRASGSRIDAVSELRFVDGDGRAESPDAAAIGYDPFVIARISQLRACEEVFVRHVGAKGINAFVRTAYVYMLERSADLESLALYADMLRNGALTPFGLLEMISESQEFRAQSRALAAPNAPGFPFIEAANAG